MTKSTITRERLQEIAEDGFLKHGESKVLARMALAAMDSEPVFTLEVSQADYKGQKLGNHFGFITLDAARKLKEGNYQLYRHAQPVPVVSADLLHTAASAIEDLLEHTDPNTSYYSGVWVDVPGKLRAAAMLQSGNSPVVPDERAAFNAWNNDVDCPLAGRDAKSAAWLAWQSRAAMLAAAPQEVK